MNTPRISIVVPVYNVDEYLEECIESIIKQSYPNIQIILVDDGSTDLSGLICDKYAQNDSRIEVIHQNNAGLVEARKAGLKRTIGEYVGFVDGDDYIDENMYERLLDYALQENVDIVHTGYWYETGNQSYVKTDYDAQVLCSENDRIRLVEAILNMETNIEPSICSKLFKRELVIDSYKNVKSSCSYGEDLVCFIASIINSEKIYLVNKAYYHYRIRNTSLSHGMGVGGIDKEVILRDNMKEVLMNNNLYESYKDNLDYYFGKNIVKQMKNICKNPFEYATYYFENPQLLQDKRIILYGAGAVGKDYYSQFCRYTHCNVVAWADNNYDKKDFAYIDVIAPEHIQTLVYDYVVIAVSDYNAAIQIAEYLRTIGVSKEKIVWERPCLYQ